MKKHKFIVKLEEPGWPSDTKEVFVNAPPDVAKADVASAVHQCNPREFFPQDANRRSLTLVFGIQPPESPKEGSNTSTNYKNTNSAAQISSNIESHTNVMFSSNKVNV